VRKDALKMDEGIGLKDKNLIMRFTFIVLSVLGSFSAFSQSSQSEVVTVNGVTTTKTTTGNVTTITTVRENKLDVKQLQRPERIIEKPQIEGVEKKKPTKEPIKKTTEL
jgi:cell division protein FtsL